jgi:urease accessory protein
MLKVFEILDQPRDATLALKLPFELRQKSRLKVTLDDGTEAGLMLTRGHLLRGGDCLRAEDGRIIRIEAAHETVSIARHADPLMIARASYHLGNRHVALQIGEGWLRYQHNHVLDDMVIGLGLQVSCESAPFEPEAGAYGGGHGHSHEHDHGDDHLHRA